MARRCQCDNPPATTDTRSADAYCSPKDVGVCDSCWSRQKADQAQADRLDHDARRRQRDQQEFALRMEQRRRDEASWAAAGPSWLDRHAAKIRTQGLAKAAAKDAARATEPFNLFWYERVAVVAGAALALLMFLSVLPTFLQLLVLVGGGVAVHRYRGRPFHAVGRVAGRFVTGEGHSPRPRTADRSR